MKIDFDANINFSNCELQKLFPIDRVLNPHKVLDSMMVLWFFFKKRLNYSLEQAMQLFLLYP